MVYNKRIAYKYAVYGFKVCNAGWAVITEAFTWNLSQAAFTTAISVRWLIAVKRSNVFFLE